MVTKQRSSPLRSISPVQLSPHEPEIPQELTGLSKPKLIKEPRPQLMDVQVRELQPNSKTIANFWIKQGWYKKVKPTDPKAIFVEGIGTIRLTLAKWKNNEKVRIKAVKFLVQRVLKKNPWDVTAEDFHLNGLGGLLTAYYHNSPFEALLKAGLITSDYEEYMRNPNHNR